MTKTVEIIAASEKGKEAIEAYIAKMQRSSIVQKFAMRKLGITEKVLHLDPLTLGIVIKNNTLEQRLMLSGTNDAEMAEVAAKPLIAEFKRLGLEMDTDFRVK